MGLTLLAAMIITLTVFASNTRNSLADPGKGAFDPLAIGFVSVAVIVLLFYGLRRRGEQVARLVVAGVIIGGTVSGLALLNFWFAKSQSLPALFYILVAPLGYMGVYWSFRSYSGSLSPRGAALIMATSATLLGLLVGTLFPILFTVLLLFGLSILDVLFVEGRFLTSVLGAKNYDRVVTVTTLPLREHLVGLGDFLVYSILVAASLRAYGIYAAVETIVLILVGALVTFQLVKSRFSLPGLAIPIWLGLIPSIVGLYSV